MQENAINTAQTVAHAAIDTKILFLGTGEFMEASGSMEKYLTHSCALTFFLMNLCS